MKTFTQLFLFPIILVLLTAPAWGAKQDIKTLMGENFQNLHIILNDLIIANYETLAKDAAVIEEHANMLMTITPATVLTSQQKELYSAYANMLRMRTRHLIEVGNALMLRDQASKISGELNVDYLRVVVAEHFGQMITTCVLCHNQFRRQALK